MARRRGPEAQSGAGAAVGTRRRPASSLHGANPFAKISVCRWRSSAVERLICNQRVGGSIPSASSNRCRKRREVPGSGGQCQTTADGEVAKRSNASDCKSDGPRPSKVRILPSPPVARSSRAGKPGERMRGGRNSAGRVPAFQAGCRGFESRRPLHFEGASPGFERAGEKVRSERRFAKQAARNNKQRARGRTGFTPGSPRGGLGGVTQHPPEKRKMRPRSSVGRARPW